jgi:hypothetical protein
MLFFWRWRGAARLNEYSFGTNYKTRAFQGLNKLACEKGLNKLLIVE